MFNGKEYAYEVYREKSFSAAAKKLYISQPALSNTIKRIESKLGFPIFDRSVSPIQLTEEGRIYIDTIEQLMAIEENFGHFLDDCKGMSTGKIRIGGTSMLISYTLPDLLVAYGKRYPQIELTLLELNPEEGESRLADGSLDLLLGNVPLSDTLFENLHLVTEHMFLAVPKSFDVNNELKAYWQSVDNIISGRFLKKMFPAVSIKHFNDIPFVLLSEENIPHQKLLSACRNEGFSPRSILSVNQELSAYHMTCAGMGACFVSDTLIAQTKENPNIIYYKLDDAISRRDIWIHYKKKRYRSKCVCSFLDMISE